MLGRIFLNTLSAALLGVVLALIDGLNRMRRSDLKRWSARHFREDAELFAGFGVLYAGVGSLFGELFGALWRRLRS